MAVVRLVLRIVVAVLGFAAIVFGALSKAAVLPDDWNAEPWFLIVAGAIAFTDALIGIFTARFDRTALELQVQLEKAVRASMITIAKTANTDIVMLGGSVFRVKRVGFRRRKMLHRLVRSRLSDSPQESTVKWTAGKGAIGDAWEQKKTIHREWTGVAKSYGSSEMTRASFERIKPKTRDGFTYEDFRTIAGKYAEILAVPLLSDGKCIGVLALDIPYNEQTTTCLNSREIKGIAESCAQVLSNVIR